MQVKRLLIGIAFAAQSLTLAACGGSGAQEAGPIGVDEEQALSDAAEMLDDPREGAQDAESVAEPSEGNEREGL